MNRKKKRDQQRRIGKQEDLENIIRDAIAQLIHMGPITNPDLVIDMAAGIACAPRWMPEHQPIPPHLERLIERDYSTPFGRNYSKLIQDCRDCLEAIGALSPARLQTLQLLDQDEWQAHLRDLEYEASLMN